MYIHKNTGIGDMSIWPRYGAPIQVSSSSRIPRVTLKPKSWQKEKKINLTILRRSNPSMQESRPKKHVHLAHLCMSTGGTPPDPLTTLVVRLSSCASQLNVHSQLGHSEEAWQASHWRRVDVCLLVSGIYNPHIVKISFWIFGMIPGVWFRRRGDVFDYWHLVLTTRI